jgi:glycosyltransferase involved in cell wall biosynthesis
MERSMRKILAVSSSAGLLGAARSFELLINHLDRGEWLPLVVCPSCGPLVNRLQQAAARVEVIKKDPYINAHCLDGPAFRLSLDLPWRLVFRWRYLRQLQRLIQKEDVGLVYLNTVRNATTAWAAWMIGKPIVWHIREGANEFIGVRKLRLMSLLRLADKVVVVSHHNRQLMLDLGVAADKLITIHNAVDLNYFTPPDQRDDALSAQLGILPQDIVIGIVAQWSKQKGVTQFLQAAYQLKKHHANLKFILVGGPSPSEPEQAEKIRELVQELGLAPEVRMVGHQEDVRPYLGLMDIFVMPSLGEAFTRVNLEAMAMGKVVIATDVGGTREGVVEGETGFLVPPDNPAAIVAKALLLIDNPELIKKMGQRGRERVEKFFTVEEYVRQVQAVWSAVLDAPSC